MNKIMQKYHASQNLAMTPTKMVSVMFLRCSQWMNNVEEHIQKKEHYQRFENSEKVILTLTNLLTVFDEESVETKSFVQGIKEFCMMILSFITEVNQQENLVLCRHTSTLLKEMGEVWQNA